MNRSRKSKQNGGESTMKAGQRMAPPDASRVERGASAPEQTTRRSVRRRLSRDNGALLIRITWRDAVRVCFCQKCFTFSGRSAYREYWLFFHFILLVLFLTFFLLMVLAMGISQGPLYDDWALRWVWVVQSVVSVVLLIPLFSATVRRLHDVGSSGRSLWHVLIPVMGLFYLIGWLTQDGEHRTNAYGPYISVIP